MKCPECGLELSDFYRFCSRCGAILSAPINVNDRSLDEPKTRIQRAIAQRKQSDRVIWPWWILILVIVEIMVFIIYFAIIISSIDFYDPYPEDYLHTWTNSIVVLDIFGIMMQVALCVLAYLMIRRLNAHFQRERVLRTALLDLVRAASIPTKKYDIVAAEVYQMEGANNVAEKERDPVIWTIGIGLSIVTSVLAVIMILWFSEDMGVSLPGLGLSLGLGLPLSLISLVCTFYVLYFLSKDFYEHDSRWYNFSYTARIALSKLGFPKGGSFRVTRLPQRSMVLYIVLSIFLGVFIYYWWYADLKDPNEHFRSQWEFEDHLWAVLDLR